MICGNDAIRFYKERIKELEILYELDKNSDNLELINSFNSLFKRERYNFILFELINDLRWRLVDKKNFINSYNEIDEKVLNVIIKMDNILSEEFDLDRKKLEIIAQKINKKDSLELVDDFFYSLGNKTLLSEYIKIRDDELPNIYLGKSHIVGENYGLTIYDHLYDTSFSKINMSGTINDPITIAHEIMHMIFFNLFSYGKIFALSEIEGAFSDYIFADFLQKKKIVNHSSIQINYEYFYLIKENCRTIRKANNYFDNKKILSFISYKKDPYLDADYNLSYLAALDLFFVYLDDKKYAINELISLGNKDVNTIYNLFNNDKYNNFNRDDFNNFRYVLEKTKKD